MAREVISVVVIDSTILFAPDGDVHSWMGKITKEIAREARLLAPPTRTMRRSTTKYVNTGKLQRSIKALPVTQTSGHVDDGGVRVGTKYYKYVLGGTAHQGMRYIYSDTGWEHKAIIDAAITRRGVVSMGMMGVEAKWLPPSWAMRFRTDGARIFRVRGQKRNPFLTSGYNRVANRHGALGQPMQGFGEYASPYL